jgi:Zn finger protein HypA/HybF involved in hydrogenase expression
MTNIIHRNLYESMKDEFKNNGFDILPMKSYTKILLGSDHLGNIEKNGSISITEDVNTKLQWKLKKRCGGKFKYSNNDTIYTNISDIVMCFNKFKKRKTMKDSVKGIVAGRQYYKCANPHDNCPLYYRPSCPGHFGQEGFEIDHIKEYSISKDDSLDNLQALCPSCHSLKTKLFYVNR